MGSRVDKYKDSDNIPMRSNKNQELYRQVYNAYDEFENLVVPSNAREISMSDLKKEITSRQEYHNKTDNNMGNNTIIRKEKILEEQNKEEEVYDINRLIDKAVDKKREDKKVTPVISNGDYLKRLKLDNRKTNIEQVKEIYDDLKEDASEDEDPLLKTANLSLEILSDLKSDNNNTMVSAPIKNEELPASAEMDFYSNNYKFSKKDFEDMEYKEEISEEDEPQNTGNGKFFLKVLLLVLGIFLFAAILIFVIKYFNKV